MWRPIKSSLSLTTINDAKMLRIIASTWQQFNSDEIFDIFV